MKGKFPDGLLGRLVVSFILLLTGLQLAHAQYVRKNHFASEQARRQVYDLDDWIAYAPSHHFTSVTVGSNYIYFATDGGGIWRYHLYENFWDFPFTTSNGLPSNRVSKVLYDGERNILWAFTDKDVAIYRFAEREWYWKSQSNFYYNPPQSPEPPEGKEIAPNVFYPREYLNRLPLYFVNGDYTLTGEWKVMDDNFDEYPVVGFLRDEWERFWFLIEGLGVAVGSPYSQRMDIMTLGLPEIETRAMAFQGNDLWVGGLPLYEDMGQSAIVRWRDDSGLWDYYYARRNSYLHSDWVYDIAANQNTVWFATNYGVSRLKGREWKTYTQSEGLYNLQVNDLLLHGNELYIGTVNGLNRLVLSTDSLFREKDEVVHLATIYQLSAQGDTIWAATNRGILRKLPGGSWKSVIPGASATDMPTTAVEAVKGEVWFASPGGVFSLNTRNGNWESYPQIGMELDGPFMDLEVLPGAVWVSTPSGLLKFDRKRYYWQLFTEEDGLINNRCYKLLLDGDYIWVATAGGLCQFYWNKPFRID
ncbi:MAG: hypothetical protein Kow0037_00540 [Calditrichia bacterium]